MINVCHRDAPVTDVTSYKMIGSGQISSLNNFRTMKPPPKKCTTILEVSARHCNVSVTFVKIKKRPKLA